MTTLPKIKYYYDYRNLNKDDLHIIELSLQCMDGRQFEIFCSKLFMLLGYKSSELTQATNDGGKDVILKTNDNETEIGRPSLQKLIGSMFSDGVRKGIFITTSSFNRNAIEYAKKVKLELWDYNTIIDKIKELDSTEVLEIAGIHKNDIKVKYDKKTNIRTIQ
jgi:HJR/Mrr/RecB family endonuclease